MLSIPTKSGKPTPLDVANYTCPRCGGGIPNDHQRGAYPGALSRWDNATEICSGCGTDEAWMQFAGQDISPTGPRPWFRTPTA